MEGELPKPLADLFYGLTGSPWFTADEVLLGALADVLKRGATRIETEVPPLIDSVKRRVRSSFDSQAAEFYEESIDKFTTGETNYVKMTADALYELAEFVEEVRKQVAYTKRMIIGQLIQLLVEIAAAIFMAKFTFGASMSMIPLLKRITSLFIQRALNFLITQLLAHVIYNTSFALVLDQLIQRNLIALGIQNGNDGKFTLDAGVGGALDGLVGGFLNKLSDKVANIFGGDFGDLLKLNLNKGGPDSVPPPGLGRGLGEETPLPPPRNGGDVPDGSPSPVGGPSPTGDREVEAGPSGGQKDGPDGVPVGGPALLPPPVRDTPPLPTPDAPPPPGGREGVPETPPGVGGRSLPPSLVDDVSHVFGRNVHDLMLPYGSTPRPWDNVATVNRFRDDMGNVFANNFGDQVGRDVARDLGRDYADAFAANWGRHEIGDALARVLDNAPGGPAGRLSPEANAFLSRELPEGIGRSLSQFGEDWRRMAAQWVVNPVEGAVSNVLGEGFSNMILTPEHEFKVTGMTAVAGASTSLVAMGGTLGGIKGIDALQNLFASNGAGASPPPVTESDPSTADDGTSAGRVGDTGGTGGGGGSSSGGGPGHTGGPDSDDLTATAEPPVTGDLSGTGDTARPAPPPEVRPDTSARPEAPAPIRTSSDAPQPPSNAQPPSATGPGDRPESAPSRDGEHTPDTSAPPGPAGDPPRTGDDEVSPQVGDDAVDAPILDGMPGDGAAESAGGAQGDGTVGGNPAADAAPATDGPTGVPPVVAMTPPPAQGGDGAGAPRPGTAAPRGGADNSAPRGDGASATASGPVLGEDGAPTVAGDAVVTGVNGQQETSAPEAVAASALTPMAREFTDALTPRATESGDLPRSDEATPPREASAPAESHASGPGRAPESGPTDEADGRGARDPRDDTDEAGDATEVAPPDSRAGEHDPAATSISPVPAPAATRTGPGLDEARGADEVGEQRVADDGTADDGDSLYDEPTVSSPPVSESVDAGGPWQGNPPTTPDFGALRDPKGGKEDGPRTVEEILAGLGLVDHSHALEDVLSNFNGDYIVRPADRFRYTYADDDGYGDDGADSSNRYPSVRYSEYPSTVRYSRYPAADDGLFDFSPSTSPQDGGGRGGDPSRSASTYPTTSGYGSGYPSTRQASGSRAPVDGDWTTDDLYGQGIDDSPYYSDEDVPVYNPPVRRIPQPAHTSGIPTHNPFLSGAPGRGQPSIAGGLLELGLWGIGTARPLVRTFASDAEAIRFGRDHWDDYVRNLPQSVQDSVRAHSDPDSYRQMNTALRSGGRLDAVTRGYIENVDWALVGRPVPEDIMVTRGMGVNHLPVAPQHMVGRSIREMGYLSTSLGGPAPSFDNNQAIVYIRVPEGTPAIWMERLSTFGVVERELMIVHDLTLSFIDVVYHNGQWHMMAEIDPYSLPGAAHDGASSGRSGSGSGDRDRNRDGHRERRGDRHGSDRRDRGSGHGHGRSGGSRHGGDSGWGGHRRRPGDGVPVQESGAGDQRVPDLVSDQVTRGVPADDGDSLYDEPTVSSPPVSESVDAGGPWRGNPPTTPDFGALRDPKGGKGREDGPRTVEEILAGLGLVDHSHALEDVLANFDGDYIVRPADRFRYTYADDDYADTAHPQYPAGTQFSPYPATVQYSQYPAATYDESAATHYQEPAASTGETAQARDEDADEPVQWHGTYTGIEDLVAATEYDVVDRRTFNADGNDGSTELMHFANGAQAVYKETEGTIRARDRADAEQLGSLVGRAIGANVPGVLRVGEFEMFMHFMSGESGTTHIENPRSPLLRTRDGHVLGLLDVLIANGDRNPGNWLDQGNGHVAGIDHGKAWFTYEYTPEDPTDLDGLAYTNGMRPFYDFDDNRWIRNPLTRDDIRWMRPRLARLYGEFERLGRTDWFDEMMARFDMLARNARGTSSLLARGSDLPGSRRDGDPPAPGGGQGGSSSSRSASGSGGGTGRRHHGSGHGSSRHDGRSGPSGHRRHDVSEAPLQDSTTADQQVPDLAAHDDAVDARREAAELRVAADAARTRAQEPASGAEGESVRQEAQAAAHAAEVAADDAEYFADLAEVAARTAERRADDLARDVLPEAEVGERDGIDGAADDDGDSLYDEPTVSSPPVSESVDAGGPWQGNPPTTPDFGALRDPKGGKGREDGPRTVEEILAGLGLVDHSHALEDVRPYSEGDADYIVELADRFSYSSADDVLNDATPTPIGSPHQQAATGSPVDPAPATAPPPAATGVPAPSTAGQGGPAGFMPAQGMVDGGDGRQDPAMAPAEPSVPAEAAAEPAGAGASGSGSSAAQGAGGGAGRLRLFLRDPAPVRDDLPDLAPDNGTVRSERMLSIPFVDGPDSGSSRVSVEFATPGGRMRADVEVQRPFLEFSAVEFPGGDGAASRYLHEVVVRLRVLAMDDNAAADAAYIEAVEAATTALKRRIEEWFNNKYVLPRSGAQLRVSVGDGRPGLLYHATVTWYPVPPAADGSPTPEPGPDAQAWGVGEILRRLRLLDVNPAQGADRPYVARQTLELIENAAPISHGLSALATTGGENRPKPVVRQFSSDFVTSPPASPDAPPLIVGIETAYGHVRAEVKILNRFFESSTVEIGGDDRGGPTAARDITLRVAGYSPPGMDRAARQEAFLAVKTYIERVFNGMYVLPRSGHQLNVHLEWATLDTRPEHTHFFLVLAPVPTAAGGSPVHSGAPVVRGLGEVLRRLGMLDGDPARGVAEPYVRRLTLARFEAMVEPRLERRWGEDVRASDVAHEGVVPSPSRWRGEGKAEWAAARAAAQVHQVGLHVDAGWPEMMVDARPARRLGPDDHPEEPHLLRYEGTRRFEWKRVEIPARYRKPGGPTHIVEMTYRPRVLRAKGMTKAQYNAYLTAVRKETEAMWNGQFRLRGDGTVVNDQGAAVHRLDPRLFATLFGEGSHRDADDLNGNEARLSGPGPQPGTGDQLHINLELADDTTPRDQVHHIITLHHGDDVPTFRDLPPMNTSTWFDSFPAKAAVHEIAHLLGLPDQYPDSKSVFRSDPRGNSVRPGPRLMNSWEWSKFSEGRYRETRSPVVWIDDLDRFGSVMEHGTGDYATPLRVADLTDPSKTRLARTLEPGMDAADPRRLKVVHRFALAVELYTRNWDGARIAAQLVSATDAAALVAVREPVTVAADARAAARREEASAARARAAGDDAAARTAVARAADFEKAARAADARAAHAREHAADTGAVARATQALQAFYADVNRWRDSGRLARAMDYVSRAGAGVTAAAYVTRTLPQSVMFRLAHTLTGSNDPADGAPALTIFSAGRDHAAGRGPLADIPAGQGRPAITADEIKARLEQWRSRNLLVEGLRVYHDTGLRVEGSEWIGALPDVGRAALIGSLLPPPGPRPDPVPPVGPQPDPVPGRLGLLPRPVAEQAALDILGARYDQVARKKKLSGLIVAVPGYPEVRLTADQVRDQLVEWQGRDVLSDAPGRLRQLGVPVTDEQIAALASAPDGRGTSSEQRTGPRGVKRPGSSQIGPEHRPAQAGFGPPEDAEAGGHAEEDPGWWPADSTDSAGPAGAESPRFGPAQADDVHADAAISERPVPPPESPAVGPAISGIQGDASGGHANERASGEPTGPAAPSELPTPQSETDGGGGNTESGSVVGERDRVRNPLNSRGSGTTPPPVSEANAGPGPADAAELRPASRDDVTGAGDSPRPTAAGDADTGVRAAGTETAAGVDPVARAAEAGTRPNAPAKDSSEKNPPVDVAPRKGSAERSDPPPPDRTGEDRADDAVESPLFTGDGDATLGGERPAPPAEPGRTAPESSGRSGLRRALAGERGADPASTTAPPSGTRTSRAPVATSETPPATGRRLNYLFRSGQIEAPLIGPAANKLIARMRAELSGRGGMRSDLDGRLSLGEINAIERQVRADFERDSRPYFAPGGHSFTIQGRGGPRKVALKLSPEGDSWQPVPRSGPEPAQTGPGSRPDVKAKSTAEHKAKSSRKGAATSAAALGGSFSITAFGLAPADAPVAGPVFTFSFSGTRNQRSTSYSVGEGISGKSEVSLKGTPEEFVNALRAELTVDPPASASRRVSRSGLPGSPHRWRGDNRGADVELTERPVASRVVVPEGLSMSIPGGLEDRGAAADPATAAPARIVLPDPFGTGPRPAGTQSGQGTRVGSGHPLTVDPIDGLTRQIRQGLGIGTDHPTSADLDRATTPDALQEILPSLDRGPVPVAVVVDGNGAVRVVTMWSVPRVLTRIDDVPAKASFSRSHKSDKEAGLTAKRTTNLKLGVGLGAVVSLVNGILRFNMPHFESSFKAEASSSRAISTGGGRAVKAHSDKVETYEVQRAFYATVSGDRTQMRTEGRSVEEIAVADARRMAGLDAPTPEAAARRVPRFDHLTVDRPAHWGGTTPREVVHQDGSRYRSAPQTGTPAPGATVPAPRPSTFYEDYARSVLIGIADAHPGLVVPELATMSKDTFARRPSAGPDDPRTAREFRGLRRDYEQAVANTLMVLDAITPDNLEGRLGEWTGPGIDVHLVETTSIDPRLAKRGGFFRPPFVSVRLHAEATGRAFGGTSTIGTEFAVSGSAGQTDGRDRNKTWSEQFSIGVQGRDPAADATGLRKNIGMFNAVAEASQPRGRAQEHGAKGSTESKAKTTGDTDVWWWDLNAGATIAKFRKADDLGVIDEGATARDQGGRDAAAADGDTPAAHGQGAAVYDGHAVTIQGPRGRLEVESAAGRDADPAGPRDTRDTATDRPTTTSVSTARRASVPQPPTTENTSTPVTQERRASAPAVSTPDMTGRAPGTTTAPAGPRRLSDADARALVLGTARRPVPHPLDGVPTAPDTVTAPDLYRLGNRLLTDTTPGFQDFLSRSRGAHDYVRQLLLSATLTGNMPQLLARFGLRSGRLQVDTSWLWRGLPTLVTRAVRGDFRLHDPMPTTTVEISTSGEVGIGATRVHGGHTRSLALSARFRHNPNDEVPPGTDPAPGLDTARLPNPMPGGSWTPYSRSTTMSTAESVTVSRTTTVGPQGGSFPYTADLSFDQAAEAKKDWKFAVTVPRRSSTATHHGVHTEVPGAEFGYIAEAEVYAAGLVDDAVGTDTDGSPVATTLLGHDAPQPDWAPRPGFTGLGHRREGPDPGPVVDALVQRLADAGLELTGTSREELFQRVGAHITRGLDDATGRAVPIDVKVRSTHLVHASSPGRITVDVIRQGGEVDRVGAKADFTDSRSRTTDTTRSAGTKKDSTVGGEFAGVSALPHNGDERPVTEAPTSRPVSLPIVGDASRQSGVSTTQSTGDSTTETADTTITGPYGVLGADASLRLYLEIDGRDPIVAEAPAGRMSELYPAPYLTGTGGPAADAPRAGAPSLLPSPGQRLEPAAREWTADRRRRAGGRAPTPRLEALSVAGDGAAVTGAGYIAAARASGWQPQGASAPEMVRSARKYLEGAMGPRVENIPAALTGLTLTANFAPASGSGTGLPNLFRDKAIVFADLEWRLHAVPRAEGARLIDVSVDSAHGGSRQDAHKDETSVEHSTTTSGGVTGRAIGTVPDDNWPLGSANDGQSTAVSSAAGTSRTTATDHPGRPPVSSKRAYLVAVPTTWLVAAESPVAEVKHLGFTRNQVGMAEVEAEVVTWVDHEQARQLGLLDGVETNKDLWDALYTAQEKFGETEKTYFEARQKLPELVRSVEEAHRSGDTARLRDARTAYDTQREKTDGLHAEFRQGFEVWSAARDAARESLELPRLERAVQDTRAREGEDPKHGRNAQAALDAQRATVDRLRDRARTAYSDWDATRTKPVATQESAPPNARGSRPTAPPGLEPTSPPVPLEARTQVPGPADDAAPAPADDPDRYTMRGALPNASELGDDSGPAPGEAPAEPRPRSPEPPQMDVRGRMRAETTGAFRRDTDSGDEDFGVHQRHTESDPNDEMPSLPGPWTRDPWQTESRTGRYAFDSPPTSPRGGTPVDTSAVDPDSADDFVLPPAVGHRGGAHTVPEGRGAAPSIEAGDNGPPVPPTPQPSAVAEQRPAPVLGENGGTTEPERETELPEPQPSHPSAPAAERPGQGAPLPERQAAPLPDEPAQQPSPSVPLRTEPATGEIGDAGRSPLPQPESGLSYFELFSSVLTPKDATPRNRVAEPEAPAGASRPAAAPAEGDDRPVPPADQAVPPADGQREGPDPADDRRGAPDPGDTEDSADSDADSDGGGDVHDRFGRRGDDDDDAPAPGAGGQGPAAFGSAGVSRSGGEQADGNGSGRSSTGPAGTTRGPDAGNEREHTAPDDYADADDDLYASSPEPSPGPATPVDPGDPWGGNPPVRPDFSALLGPKSAKDAPLLSAADVIADLTNRWVIRAHAEQEAVRQVFMAGTDSGHLPDGSGGDSGGGAGSSAGDGGTGIPVTALEGLDRTIAALAGQGSSIRQIAHRIVKSSKKVADHLHAMYARVEGVGPARDERGRRRDLLAALGRLARDAGLEPDPAHLQGLMVSVSDLVGLDRTIAALAGQGLLTSVIAEQTGESMPTVDYRLAAMYARVEGVGPARDERGRRRDLLAELGRLARDAGLEPDPAHLQGVMVSVSDLVGLDRTIAALAGQGLTIPDIVESTRTREGTVKRQLRAMYIHVEGVGAARDERGRRRDLLAALGRLAREAGLEPDPALLRGAATGGRTGIAGVVPAPGSHEVANDPEWLPDADGGVSPGDPLTDFLVEAGALSPDARGTRGVAPRSPEAGPAHDPEDLPDADGVGGSATGGGLLPAPASSSVWGRGGAGGQEPGGGMGNTVRARVDDVAADEWARMGLPILETVEGAVAGVEGAHVLAITPDQAHSVWEYTRYARDMVDDGLAADGDVAPDDHDDFWWIVGDIDAVLERAMLPVAV
ncbi:ADP-ribosyltransferase, partial [Nocardiopsis mangrovi]